MSKLRVASVYGYLCTGGDESRLIQYLAARDRERFEHIVISALDPTASSLDLNGPVYRRVEALGVEVLTLGVPCDHERRKGPFSLRHGLWQGRAFATVLRRLRATLRERRIDVVDARINMGTVLGALAGRAAGVRAVVSTNYELGRLQGPGWRQLGQAAYSQVDRLVCDSEACLAEMRGWMWAPPEGLCIPNGIARPLPTRPVAEIRAELGIPAGARVIGQIARLQPHKGQDLLLRAAATVLRAVPDAFFLLCGYRQLADAHHQHLDRILAETGIGDRVRIVSYPGEIGDIWSVVDIHAHPTRRDSSPIALLESMSLGLPAVTTRIGGIPELVEDGVTGMVIPADDFDALTEALLRLLTQPQEARRLGAAARARYEARHRPEVMAGATEALFEEVVARPRRSRFG